MMPADSAVLGLRLGFPNLNYSPTIPIPALTPAPRGGALARYGPAPPPCREPRPPRRSPLVGEVIYRRHAAAAFLSVPHPARPPHGVVSVSAARGSGPAVPAPRGAGDGPLRAPPPCRGPGAGKAAGKAEACRVVVDGRGEEEEAEAAGAAKMAAGAPGGRRWRGPSCGGGVWESPPG